MIHPGLIPNEFCMRFLRAKLLSRVVCRVSALLIEGIFSAFEKASVLSKVLVHLRWFCQLRLVHLTSPVDVTHFKKNQKRKKKKEFLKITSKQVGGKHFDIYRNIKIDSIAIFHKASWVAWW